MTIRPIKKFNLKTPGREIEQESIKEIVASSNEGTSNKEEVSSIKSYKSKLDITASGIIEAVGGIDNIEYVDSCITRVRLTLKDGALVNKIDLKKIGATEVIRVGTNNVQIIIGTLADPIVSRIKRMKK